MKLCTWNVNSIRARLDRLLTWLARTSPDIVCLQETKIDDLAFPLEAIEAAGYQAVFHGQRTYNGVAILSRSPLREIETGLGDDDPDDQARLIAATVGDVRVLSAYAPNGQIVGSEKWAYKLRWLARLRAWLNRRYRPEDRLVISGDFNVAPEERDVARPDEWRQSVLFHEEARAALQVVTDWGLVDAIRLHHEGPGPYSWWDYRMLSFAKGNGLRIDHVFLTQPLAGRCRSAWVDREERKGKLPSDHAPVGVELA